MDSLFMAAFLAHFALLAFSAFTIPSKIGKRKNLPARELRTIKILTWCGLLAGITWFIGLFLALTADRHPVRRR
ncbi:hypothetical protein [Mailhella sp.]|uniref:hypothetical protein n=1 Tax=Mailhella sp. TaxID=1981029 RepID=UPI004064C395